MKKENKIQNNYTNTYTGEKLSTYTPTAFAALKSQPVKKRTNDPVKLQQQVENFNKRYICPYCKIPMKWIKNTNIMTCQNAACLGKPIKSKDGTMIKYVPVYSQLNHRGMDIAETLLND